MKRTFCARTQVKKWCNSPPFSSCCLLLLLFFVSFEPPTNSVSVCCMLPRLFLEPDALCYLPLRPTNWVLCVCVCVCLTVREGRFVSVCKRDRKLEKDSPRSCRFFCLFSSLISCLRPPAASWRLWSSTWPLWRARRPRS